MVDKSEPMGCLWFFVRLLGFGGDGEAAAKTTELPYRLREDFLSPAELSFYRVLEQCIGGSYAINAKVRLWDLVYVPRHEGSRVHENRISSKHVDFLLCDPSTMRPRLVIELDDASHNRQDRQDRDKFVDGALAAAGLPILHIKAQRTYSLAEVTNQVGEILGVGGANLPPLKSLPQQSDSTAPPCPSCSAVMVERKAAKGKHLGKRFWACSNYPQCRHIIGID